MIQVNIYLTPFWLYKYMYIFGIVSVSLFTILCTEYIAQSKRKMRKGYLLIP